MDKLTNSSNLGEYRKKINDIIDIINIIYPIGCLYWSSDPTNPSELFGGTWTQIKDKFIYAAGSKSVNATGGEETHTLTTSETPAHTHTRGTMDITGEFMNAGTYGVVANDGTSATGAFYAKTEKANGLSGNDGNEYTLGFQASKSWTGATSSVGGNGAHNNMPPYLVKYCWERTA